MNTRSLLRMNADRVIAAALLVASLLVLFLGWFGISGKGLAPEQLPYVISGGLGGLLLVAVGCTLILSADLQDEWRELERIEGRLDQLLVNGAAESSHADMSANGHKARSRQAATRANTAG